MMANPSSGEVIAWVGVIADAPRRAVAESSIDGEIATEEVGSTEEVMATDISIDKAGSGTQPIPYLGVTSQQGIPLKGTPRSSSPRLRPVFTPRCAG
ncbi:MAG: hypothetical protein AAF485_30310, partial [Chloroflexota bacterium]